MSHSTNATLIIKDSVHNLGQLAKLWKTNDLQIELVLNKHEFKNLDWKIDYGDKRIIGKLVADISNVKNIANLDVLPSKKVIFYTRSKKADEKITGFLKNGKMEVKIVLVNGDINEYTFAKKEVDIARLN